MPIGVAQFPGLLFSVSLLYRLGFCLLHCCSRRYTHLQSKKREVELSVVLVSCGCCNKFHKLGGLTQQKHYVIVLDTRSPKSVSLKLNQHADKTVVLKNSFLIPSGEYKRYKSTSDFSLCLHIASVCVCVCV
jgi:hypothetical protein